MMHLSLNCSPFLGFSLLERMLVKVSLSQDPSNSQCCYLWQNRAGQQEPSAVAQAGRPGESWKLMGTGKPSP